MAIKASAQITISKVIDIHASYRYYKLQSSTLVKPNKPTKNPPDGWSDTEPSYVSGSTNTLYFVDCNVYSDMTFSFSEVSKSTSYEAAKDAWNKANNAQNTADDANNKIDGLPNIYTTQLEMSKTNSELRLDFTKSIASATDDMQSKLDAANNATNQKFGEISKYIRFANGKIVLGETGSELTLTVQNDRISFQQYGNEVAYFSNNNLYIRRAEVLSTLRVGNFEFAPRYDGGLILRKRGN